MYRGRAPDVSVLVDGPDSFLSDYICMLQVFRLNVKHKPQIRLVTVCLVLALAQPLRREKVRLAAVC
eukprot:scaffold3083_cov440-Prasinococcus_capsulatus_cf.AAC.7